jgi:hypothetical protein
MFPPREELPSPMEQKRILEPLLQKTEQQGFCVFQKAVQMGIDPKVISEIREGNGTDDLRNWRLLKHVFSDD